MLGDGGLRQPFLDQVVAQGLLGSVYAAAIGILVMGVTGLWREAPR
jgi:hypothetical protein